MSTGTLVPTPFQTVLDSSGNPVSGAQISFFAAGTSTPLTVYSDAALTVPLSNPVIADSAGRYVAYMGPVSAKVITADAAGVTIRSVDPVASVAVGAGGTGLGQVFSFGGIQDAGITVTSYPSGTSFATLHPGTAVFPEDSNNLVGTYVIRATGRMDTSGTLTLAIVDLDSGAPDTPLATATFTSLTGEVATSGTITFGAGGTVRKYGIKSKVSANTGFGWGVALVRTA